MKNKIVILATVTMLALSFADQSQAVTISVGWNPQTFDVTAADFNDATMTFAGINVQSLDSVTGGRSAGAFYHDHGANTTVTMDVLLNGVWTNVFTHANFGSANHLIAATFGGKPFGAGIVTGVRLFSIPNINQTYHFWDIGGPNQVMFNFSAAVPEPGTLALWFDFVEPELDPFVGSTFFDTTVGVVLLDGLVEVGAFTFNAPNDVAAFVGVWSDLSFDRVEFRDRTDQRTHCR